MDQEEYRSLIRRLERQRGAAVEFQRLVVLVNEEEVEIDWPVTMEMKTRCTFCQEPYGEVRDYPEMCTKCRVAEGIPLDFKIERPGWPPSKENGWPHS